MAPFIPALGAAFVDLDDRDLVVRNTAFRGLSLSHIKWMFTATPLGHFQPLTWLSYAIDFKLSGPGLDPEQFHRTSLVLHGLNAVLVFVLTRKLLDIAKPAGGFSRPLQLAAAAGAALLWAIHPLRVESVAWVTERRDVLSGFFFLLTTLAYLRAFGPGSPRIASIPWYIASILLLTLSLLSKAWGITYFAVALIIDWYPLRRLPSEPLAWLRRANWPILAQKLPYFILGVGFAIRGRIAAGSIVALRTAQEWSYPSRVAQAIYGLLWYPQKTLLPRHLVVLYEIPSRLNPLSPKFLAMAAILIAIGISLFVWRRRVPALTAAAAAFAVIIFPVLGFSQAGDQLVADRYSYLSMLGLTIVLATSVALLARNRESRIPVAAAGVIVLLVLGGLTWRQSTFWETTRTLWGHAIRARPDLMLGHVNYGIVLREQGDKEGALEQYRIAASLRPEDGRPWFPMGVLLEDMGDIDGAEDAYRRSAKTLPQAFMPLVNLGRILNNYRDKPDEALEMYRQAVDSIEHLRPGSIFSAKPYLVLGRALKVRGDREEAIQVLQKAAQYDETRGDATMLLKQLGAM